MGMVDQKPMFARICSYCGKPFNKGYCIKDGEKYICSFKCLQEEYTFDEIDRLQIGEDDSGSYYTEWEEEDYQYNQHGEEVREYEPVKVLVYMYNGTVDKVTDAKTGEELTFKEVNKNE